MIKKELRKIKSLRNIFRKAKRGVELISDFVNVSYYKIKGNKILYSYYARVNNFGDLFNKDLISFFNVKLIHVSDYKKSNASLLGSILHMYPPDFEGYVLGSGFIKERYNRKDHKWKVLLLRGPLSAIQCGVNENVSFGDPGILASLVYKEEKIKKYKLGIIPHSSDFDIVKNMNFGEGVFLINARKSPKKVAEDIMKCEHIASSSLHGLIFADSYHIPNIHLKFGDNLIGGLHKFNDYYLGMGLDVSPNHLEFNEALNIKTIIDSCKLNFSEEITRKKQEEIITIYTQFLNSHFND
jgi:pyruvyltransferase